MMELHFKIIGSLQIFLALIHVIFPRYFKWKEELAGLSLINREMMSVHTFFIALIVLLFGILTVSSSHDLLFTELGRRICMGLSFFWGVRFYFQFFVYSSALWRGKRFETIVHVVFSFVWVYFTIIYGKAAL